VTQSYEGCERIDSDTATSNSDRDSDETLNSWPVRPNDSKNGWQQECHSEGSRQCQFVGEKNPVHYKEP
jgi:hypothetical protein